MYFLLLSDTSWLSDSGGDYMVFSSFFFVYSKKMYQFPYVPIVIRLLVLLLKRIIQYISEPILFNEISSAARGIGCQEWRETPSFQPHQWSRYLRKDNLELSLIKWNAAVYRIFRLRKGIWKSIATITSFYSSSSIFPTSKRKSTQMLHANIRRFQYCAVKRNV